MVAHKTKELFDHAEIALEHSGITGLEDQLIFIIDDIINILVNNKPLLNFISKNLVMGALKSAFWAEDEGDKIFYERYLELVEADEHEYQDIDIMPFTILELAGSTGYNSILFEEPVSIEKYKPFLYRTVRLIIQSHRNSAHSLSRFLRVHEQFISRIRSVVCNINIFLCFCKQICVTYYTADFIVW